MQTTGTKPPDLLSPRRNTLQPAQATEGTTIDADRGNSASAAVVVSVPTPAAHVSQVTVELPEHGESVPHGSDVPAAAHWHTAVDARSPSLSVVSTNDGDGGDDGDDGHRGLTPLPDGNHSHGRDHSIHDRPGDAYSDVEPATPHIIAESDVPGEDTATTPCVCAHCPSLAKPTEAIIASARNLVDRARGMTWRQIVFVSVLVALVMVGNFMQILMLNFWLVSFPADGTPGNYTAFAVPGILFSFFFLFWCVGYIIIKRPNLSFAKHRYGWTLLISIGFCDTFNSWLATYAASHTSEVLQALFTNLSPLYAVFMSKWILKDPRKYWNPWIIAVFALTITGILAASLYGVIKEGKHMEDGRWWILIFFASIPFRVLQNVIQSLYMIVYTKDESFTFWLRNRLALISDVTGGKRHRKKKSQRKAILSGNTSPDGVIDNDVADEDDEDGVRQVGTAAGQGTAWKNHPHKRAAGYLSNADEEEEEDEAGEYAGILDERTLAEHLLLQEQQDAHMVPMVLPVPPPSMAASFARNPDVGGAVTNASIAHSLLPREPSLVALGNGSDVHIHNHAAPRGNGSGSASAAPSVDSFSSEAHRVVAQIEGDEAVVSQAAADAARAEEIVAVRYHQGEDTIVKLVMLAGETVAQMCFTLALLPADALPWWGNSDSVANTWSNFLEGIICVFTIPKNFLFGFLYTLGFVFTYVGGAYLNHYSVALCAIVTQLSSPLTALVLVLVPSWNVMEGGDSPWFCSVIAIVFLSVAALLYVMWEEKTDDEKIEGERVLKMTKLHVRPLEEVLEHVEVSVFSSDD